MIFRGHRSDRSPGPRTARVGSPPRPQGPVPPLRVVGTVTPGAVIVVEVGCVGDTLEISNGAPGQWISVPVGPDRTARFVVPGYPGGTVLCLACGKGLAAKCILIEVIAP